MKTVATRNTRAMEPRARTADLDAGLAADLQALAAEMSGEGWGAADPAPPPAGEGAPPTEAEAPVAAASAAAAPAADLAPALATPVPGSPPELAGQAPAGQAPAGQAPARPRRRGPGRPPRAPAPVATTHCGVVGSPRHPGDRLELGHGDPAAWKKIFAFFDRLKSTEIHIHVSPPGLQIYTSDNSGGLRVCVNVEGRQMNWYYCREEYWIRVATDHVSPIFANITKNCHYLRWRCHESNPEVLELTLVDYNLNKHNVFPVTVSTPVVKPEWVNVRELFTRRDTYRVRWTIPQASFKKSHEIAAKTASVIQVIVAPGDDGRPQLRLQFNGTGIEDYSEVYRNSQKIQLQTLLAPDETFLIEYSAAEGKILSAASPAEVVTLYCTERESVLAVFDERPSGDEGLGESNGIHVITAMSVHKA